MKNGTLSMLRHYGLAVVCVIVALLVRLGLAPIFGERSPLLLFLIGVTVAAWYGGVGPGLLAMILGLLLADYYFISPLFALGPANQQQFVQFALFVAEGIAISLLASRLKTALYRLEARDRRINAILDTAVDAIITIDQRGVIQSLNPTTEQMFGYTAAELIGKNVKMLMPSPYCDEHDGYLEHYLRTGEKHIIGTSRQVQHRRKNGSSFSAELAVSQFDDMGQLMFTGVVRDLTARQALEQQVVQTSTLEQRSIGQQLHDTTAQELTAAAMFTDRLKAALLEKSPAEAQIAAKIAEILKRAQRQVRGISRGLMPVEVHKNGLTTALTELAEQSMELHGVICVFDRQKPVSMTDNHVATQLYYIAREAVNNALKHSQAHTIRISLEDDGRAITLRVQDDGIGLPEPPVDTKGLGIKIMLYRAELLKGHLSIGRAKPAGTIVTCTWSQERPRERSPSSLSTNEDLMVYDHPSSARSSLHETGRSMDPTGR